MLILSSARALWSAALLSAVAGGLLTRADAVVFTGIVRDGSTGQPVEGATVSLDNIANSATDKSGRYVLKSAGLSRGQTLVLLARRIGYTQSRTTVTVSGDTVRTDLRLVSSSAALAAVTVTSAAASAPANAPRPTSSAASEQRTALPSAPFVGKGVAGGVAMGRAAAAPSRIARDAARNESGRRGFADSSRTDWNREQYDRIEENPFLAVAGNPRSTFSVDVDRASYGNVRRFILQGQKPPADAVRIEELVNYFPYTLAEPKGRDPVAITTEVTAAPWQPKHHLVRVALQSRRIETSKLPPSNLVFLIDVSGSMATPDKLPLVKQSLRLLVEQLREQDRVALVVYAGAAGLVLPSTPGHERTKIMSAIDALESGGSTAGGAGIELAYRTAKENYLPNGNNRVILATDGDFNVGASSDAEMERLIERKRAEGTYLTVLGFGTGNYQDAKMEKLAKKGNGNYAYVDDIAEARKTLVHEMGATLLTVANDVKLQVEFNPAAVSGYRLIGYEDRLLRDEDFNDDRKDAGDIGTGHVVTALYEVVPAGVTGTVKLRGTDALRYEQPASRDGFTEGRPGELMYVKLRYKTPGDSTSKLMTHPVAARPSASASADFRFAAAVAGFGMLLRDSEHKGNASTASILGLARGAVGADEGGYRGDFIRLVERWRDTRIAERDQ